MDFFGLIFIVVIKLFFFFGGGGVKGLRIMLRGQKYFWNNIASTTFVQQILYKKLFLFGFFLANFFCCFFFFLGGVVFKWLRIMYRGQNYFWNNTTSTKFSQQILYNKLLLVGLNVMLVLGP